LLSSPTDNLHPSVGEGLPDACGTATERDEGSLSRLSSEADFGPSSALTDDPGDPAIASLPFLVHTIIDMTTVDIDPVLGEQMATYGCVPSDRSYPRSDEDDNYGLDLAAALQDLESPDLPDSTAVLQELTVLGVDPEDFDDDFHLHELSSAPLHLPPDCTDDELIALC
jgi:hypothetical protein